MAERPVRSEVLRSRAPSVPVLPVLAQALMVLRHFPDTWLEYATWHTRVGGAKSAPAAIEVLTRAVKVRLTYGHPRRPTAALELQGKAVKYRSVQHTHKRHIDGVISS